MSATIISDLTTVSGSIVQSVTYNVFISQDGARTTTFSNFGASIPPGAPGNIPSQTGTIPNASGNTPSSAGTLLSETTTTASQTTNTTQPSASKVVTPQSPSNSSREKSSSAGTTLPKSTQSHTATSDNRLANGTVAGIVIATALGLALLTFLLTFWIMRRRKSGNRSVRAHPSDHQTFEMAKQNQASLSSSPLEPDIPLPSQTSQGQGALESYLPQPADDATVCNNVKTMLDQIELHVENFYRRNSEPGTSIPESEIQMFESRRLPESLISMLKRNAHTDALPLIKHTLVYHTVSAVTTNGNAGTTLLPSEFVRLPDMRTAEETGGSKRPGRCSPGCRARSPADIIQGIDQSISRWRVLTAYLRRPPLQDPQYVSERDRRINESVLQFSKAFAAWRDMKYTDEVRNRSLSAILRSAAELGIWIFSQPSDLRFRWVTQDETLSNAIVVAPALIKVTDERGRALKQPQVMLEAVTKKLRPHV